MGISIFNPSDVEVNPLYNPWGKKGGKVLRIAPKETKTFSEEEAKYLLRIYGRNQLDPQKHKDEGFLKIVKDPEVVSGIEILYPEKQENQSIPEIQEKIEIQEKKIEDKQSEGEKRKEYVCEDCGRSFSMNVALQGHKRSHRK